MLALSVLFKRSEDEADMSEGSRLRTGLVLACAFLAIAGVVFEIAEVLYHPLTDHTNLGVVFSTLKFLIGTQFIVNGRRIIKLIRQSQDISSANQQRRERFARFVFYTGVAAVFNFANSCMFSVYVRSVGTLYIGILGDLFLGSIVSMFSISTIRAPNHNGRPASAAVVPTGFTPS